MNPAGLPIARELFAQWQRARGARSEPATKPFSRSWEELLNDAGLVSGIDRTEAEKDSRSLEQLGLLALRSARYKAYQIERIAIPLAAEVRWCEAFGFIPGSDEETRRIREFAWEPELSFLRDANVNLPFEELQKLNEFLKRRDRKPLLVPIKERSLEIFGDEKRLDLLLASALFRPGRLELEAQFHCEVIAVPLGWKRGPATAATQPIIVIENAATWHSYCLWNARDALFSAVVYGEGNRLIDAVAFLREIFDELGGSRRVFYFGDIDPQGLNIPQQASKRAKALGLPEIEPHLWSYRQLLDRGSASCEASDEASDNALCDWLGKLASPARRLFANHRRLAQEHVGWELLSSYTDSTG